MEKSVYVTVGTTSFDELVKKIDSSEFRQILHRQHVKKLTIQIGRGEYIPFHRYDEDKTVLLDGIYCSFYRYKNEYMNDIKQADLIISHAGAGSIMDALSCSKKILVVVNENLMNNHQTEVADALASRKYLTSTNCSDILIPIQNIMMNENIRSYPDVNYDAFPAVVDNEMGFNDKWLQ